MIKMLWHVSLAWLAITGFTVLLGFVCKVVKVLFLFGWGLV